MKELILLIFDDKDLSKEDVKKAISKYLYGVLKNKKIKDSKKHNWIIEKVDSTYVDLEEKFFSVDIYIKNYDSRDYFLYDDDKFVENLDNEIKAFNVSFSEQGMQGDDYINLDVEFK